MSGLDNHYTRPGFKTRERHRLLAFLIAQGKTAKEAAALTGYDDNAIGQMMEAPLFKVAVKEEAKRIREVTTDRLADAIVGEGPATLERLVRLRDAAESEKVQLGAAQTLFDRVAPKRVEEERVVRITLDSEAIAALKSTAAVALRADPQLAYRFKELESQVVEPSKPHPALVPIDEAIAQLREAE